VPGELGAEGLLAVLDHAGDGELARPAERQEPDDRRLMKTRLTGAALVLSAAAVLVLSGASALGSLGGQRPVTREGFTIRGHAGGLYPGARKRLSLVVHNRSATAIHVRSIATRVRDARPGCTGKNVRVGRYLGRLRVGPHGWRRVSVQIRMLRSAPDACKRALFRFKFRGTATR
jgi:hypothetical protein